MTLIIARQEIINEHLRLHTQFVDNSTAVYSVLQRQDFSIKFQKENAYDCY